VTVSLVYVHLGTNPSPTLLNYAQLIRAGFPSVKLFLISDDPTRWKSFPGTIIDASKVLKTIFPLFWRLKYYEKFSIAGGYWINTLSRLFLFKLLQGHIPEDDLVIHLESDVICLPTESFISNIRSVVRSTSIERFDENNGIASIVIAPDIHNLIKSFELLRELLLESDSWISDMRLLGLGLERSILKELQPIDLSPSEEPAILMFDGFKFGRYLFGLDAIHQQGVSRGGIVWTGLEKENLVWSISSFADQEVNCIEFKNDSHRNFLFNIHIHAKTILPSLPCRDEFWHEVTRAANGEIPFPERTENPSLFIHEQNGNLLARCVRFCKMLWSRV
jgi:hypothetical protein